ncbi:MAG: putative TIM-barrel fold metal-dependent hydrolase [Verrucomicrobiales bacterium]|jgi:predicted TIM-barrel fold metal-dependent hydrolase
MTLILIVFGLALALAALRLLLFQGPLHTPVTPPPEGILDMHCHTAGIGAGDSGAWISDEMRTSWKFGLYLRVFGSSEKQVSTEGDQILMDIIARSIRESVHVDGAVILAMDAPYSDDGELDRTSGEIFVPNRFIGETVKLYPELYFGASVHPNRADALQELTWSKQNDALLVKWLPNIQNINPSDERHVPYYEKLIELNLPLLTHVGDEDSFSKTNNALGDPQLLRLALKMGVRVIAAHVASSGKSQGQDNVERLLEMMPEYPNLVADLSTLTQTNRRRHLRKVLNDARLEGRLMYGTDYPLTNTPLVTPWQYPFNLTLSQLWRLGRTRNSWDRDVQLKAALGVSPAVFKLSREYLGL